MSDMVQASLKGSFSADNLPIRLIDEKMSVSIIIVNYNGLLYMNKLLTSLQNQTYTHFEIVLIDNASSDDSLRSVDKYAEILSLKIIKNRVNVGFCEAVNQGLNQSNGKWVVLLNNDTYLDIHWLEELVKRANLGDKPVAVVSRILDEGSKLSIYGNNYDFYGATLAQNTLSRANFFYGSGASLMVEREVFKKIGGLDSALFMYQDDPDLCWRLRLINRKIVCADRSICYHMQSSGTVLVSNMSMPVWKFYFAHPRNRIRVLTKNYSGLNILKRLPQVVVLIEFRAILLTTVNKNPNYLSAVMKGFVWNLRHLSETLKQRHIIQHSRRVTDGEIESFMQPYSIELWGFRNYSLQTKNCEVK